MAVATYNSNALVKDLTDAIADDPNVKRIAWARSLQIGARAFNDFAAFEAKEVPIGRQMSSPAGIFCVKSDLKASGGDEVKFTVISDMAGPGVNAEAELTGSTSTAEFHTWQCRVEWYRDATEYTKKMLRHIAAGGDVWPVSKMLLEKKLGRKQQSDMMLFLREPARNIGAGRMAYGYNGNMMRPNYRATRDGLYATDVIDPSFSVLAKNKATENGAQPIRMDKNAFGTRVMGYLFFGTATAMTDIRNDSGYQNAIENAGNRGDDNAVFTGRLVEWQGLHYFEHHVVQPDWNGPIGSPLAPRLKVGVAVSGLSTAGNDVLKAHASNTTHDYTQWWPGFDYINHWYPDIGAPAVGDTRYTTDVYYGWGVNPSDGSVVFFSYTGADNNGNFIDNLTFLDPDVGAAGSATVGNLDATGDTLWGSTAALRGAGGDGTGNTSANYTYAADLEVGATCFSANANGAIIGHSFLFGANAAVRAYGSVEVNPITQDRDFGFIKGHGFESVYGQAPCMRSDAVTNNYVIMEHAIAPEGFDVPSLAAP